MTAPFLFRPLFDLHRLETESFAGTVEHHPVLASTNDRGLELAQAMDLPTPILVVTDEQTSGRGRGSNAWWSETGALTFSLVLDPQAAHLSPAHWPRLALTVGLSVCEALESLLPRIHCGLKWPNDVLVENKKICGILVEVPPNRSPSPPRLVIGVGVNINNSLQEAPEAIRAVGTALCDLSGVRLDLTEVLLEVLQRIAVNIDALAAGAPQLAENWQRRSTLDGRTVMLQAGPREVTGVCVGVDEEGALVLQTASGQERFFGGVLASVSDAG